MKSQEMLLNDLLEKDELISDYSFSSLLRNSGSSDFDEDDLSCPDYFYQWIQLVQ